MELKRNDTLTFKHDPNSTGGALVVSNLSNFTNNTTSYLGAGSQTVRTVSSAATIGSLINVFFDMSGSPRKTFYAEVISSVLSTPIDFDMGSSVITASLSTYYTIGEFPVQGINTSVSVTTSGCQYQKNGGSWVTSGTVVNGDILTVRALSSSGYDTTTSHTITVGGVSDTNYIRTKINPADGTRVPFPYTTNISLKKVTEFFGAPLGGFNTQPPRNMSAYRKGGLYVPNIPENSAIADTNQVNNLKLSSFAGSSTVVYFDRAPSNKSKSESTVGVSKTVVLHWAATTDWSLGYSPLMALNAEYKYQLIENTGGDKTTGVTFFTETGNAGTFSKFNDTFTVQVTSGANTEARYSGTVRITLRSLLDPSILIEQDVYYFINFFSN
jgi:hypothetical protein